MPLETRLSTLTRDQLDDAGVRALSVPLDSERLHLEPIGARHARVLFGPMQDLAIYTWISSKPPASVEALEDRWARAAARLQAFHPEVYLDWAVRRTSDGAWIGKMDADIDASGIAINVGYLFFPAFWGRGYATEAVTTLANHLESLGVREQRAAVTSGNVASEAVLARAGFVRTRILPGNDCIRGVVVDDIEYVRRRPTIG